MTADRHERFSYRAFWSLLLTVTALSLPWSGVVLHTAGHEGSTGATHAWMAVHWAFALQFTVAVAGHIVVNRRALLRYFQGLSARVLPLSREAITALAVAAGLMLLALGHTRLGRHL